MRRALLILMASLPTLAWAGPHRAAVLDLLNAYESTPTAAELKAIGPEVDAELMEIADDGAIPLSRRGRAVSALAWFPSDRTRTFLEDRLQKGDKSILRRKAAYALAEGWQDRAFLPLSTALSDSDVQVRIAVANALGRLDSDRAREALRGQLEKEPEASVREAIQKSLAGGR